MRETSSMELAKRVLRSTLHDSLSYAGSLSNTFWMLSCRSCKPFSNGMFSFGSIIMVAHCTQASVYSRPRELAGAWAGMPFSRFGINPFVHCVLLDQLLQHIRAHKRALTGHQVKAEAAIEAGDVLEELECFVWVLGLLEDVPGAATNL